MTTVPISRSDLSDPRVWLTVERLLYAVIVLFGAALRFYGLGSAPLTPAEAAQSWPIWQAAQGLSLPDAPPSYSALVSTLQLLLFWLTQGGDTVARWASAFAGTALLATPWLLRHWLGRSSALAVALLMAIDPWLVAFSRLADGAMLATALALFSLAFLARLEWADRSGLPLRGPLFAAAATVGLLLVSGPLAWSYLPIVLLFGVGVIGPRLGVEARRTLRVDLVPALLAGAAAALLGATAWFARPAGLASLGTSLQAWLAQFTPGNYPLTWTLARLVVDQPFALVFGLLGFVMLWRQRRQLPQPPGAAWPIFLTIWLLWGIVGQMLPGRLPQGLLVLGLPLLFAACYPLGWLMTRPVDAASRREGAILIATLIVLLIAGRFAVNALVAAPVLDVNLALVAILVGMAMLLVWIVFALWTERDLALWYGGVFLATWLLLATLGNSWHLAHGQDPQRPSGLLAEVGHRDVRALATDMRTLSAQRSGDATAKPVQVQMTTQPDPMLGWYLRDRRVLTWVLAPTWDVAASRPLIVTLGRDLLAAQQNPEQTVAPAGYIGSSYDTRARWLPDQLFQEPVPAWTAPTEDNGRQSLRSWIDGYWRVRIQPFLRWMLHHKVTQPPLRTNVQLWVMPEE